MREHSGGRLGLGELWREAIFGEGQCKMQNAKCKMQNRELT